MFRKTDVEIFKNQFCSVSWEDGDGIFLTYICLGYFVCVCVTIAERQNPTVLHIGTYVFLSIMCRIRGPPELRNKILYCFSISSA